MIRENGEQKNEQVPIIPEVQETLADLSEFKTVYPPAEKFEVDDATQKDIEKLQAEIKFRASDTNEAIKDALKKQTPGDEKWDNTPTHTTSAKKGWFKNTMTALLGSLALFGAKESKATTHSEDSLKNKIESVVKKGDPVKKDSAKTTTLETGREEAFSDQLRIDWNNYQAWLKSIDMAGNEALDKNDLGGQMIDRYRKEHPNTLVSRETIDDIQQEFAKYREWVLAEVKAGRATLTPGTTEQNFMAQLSKIDGIAGQFTTAHRFPDAYLQTFQNGKLVKTEHKGFAKTGTTVLYPGAAKDSK